WVNSSSLRPPQCSAIKESSVISMPRLATISSDLRIAAIRVGEALGASSCVDCGGSVGFCEALCVFGFDAGFVGFTGGSPLPPGSAQSGSSGGVQYPLIL